MATQAVPVTAPAEIVRSDEHRGAETLSALEVPADTSEQVRTEISPASVAEAWRKNQPTMLEEALLACGIVAPLLYAASDVIAGMRWRGYSFRDQTISELNAIGAPTRNLTIVLGVLGYTFLVAFGIGVWRSARGDRGLQVAGVALLMLGVSAWWAVPYASMHVRGAETSFTDTLHLVDGGVAGLFLMVAMWFGASALGTRFRVYSIATVVVMLVFLVWSGMDGSRVVEDLSTPWLGVKERVWAYVYQLWLVVFAIALLRRHLAAQGRPRLSDGRDVAAGAAEGRRRHRARDGSTRV